MFDASLGELTVCVIVGFVVLGPEKMAITIRTVAGWISAIKIMANSAMEQMQEVASDLGDVKKEIHSTAEFIEEASSPLKLEQAPMFKLPSLPSVSAVEAPPVQQPKKTRNNAG